MSSGIRLDGLKGWVDQRIAPLRRAYWMLVAALTILCFTTAALWLVLRLLGVPVPLPPPIPLPVAPGASRTGAWSDSGRPTAPFS